MLLVLRVTILHLIIIIIIISIIVLIITRIRMYNKGLDFSGNVHNQLKFYNSTSNYYSRRLIPIHDRKLIAQKPTLEDFLQSCGIDRIVIAYTYWIFFFLCATDWVYYKTRNMFEHFDSTRGHTKENRTLAVGKSISLCSIHLS